MVSAHCEAGSPDAGDLLQNEINTPPELVGLSRSTTEREGGWIVKETGEIRPPEQPHIQAPRGVCEEHTVDTQRFSLSPVGSFTRGTPYTPHSGSLAGVTAALRLS